MRLHTILRIVPVSPLSVIYSLIFGAHMNRIDHTRPLGTSTCDLLPRIRVLVERTFRHRSQPQKTEVEGMYV